MTTAIDPRVRLTFATKGPDRTAWLEISSPADAEPEVLYAALRAAGWTEGRYRPLPPYPATDERFQKLGWMVQERMFGKPGTDLFTGWTDAEAPRFMREARGILRGFGFTRVPVWHKTLHDML